MKSIAKELKYNLVFWSAVDGLVDVSKNSTTAANDPLEALIAIKDMKEKTLILLRDFHLFLQDPTPFPRLALGKGGSLGANSPEGASERG